MCIDSQLFSLSQRWTGAGNESDMENLRYCLYGIAQDPEWMPGRAKAEILNGARVQGGSG